jgi:hypothetical protein
MEEVINIFDSLHENIPPQDSGAPNTKDPIPQPSKIIDHKNLKSSSHSIKNSRMNQNNSKNSHGPKKGSLDSIQVFSPPRTFQHHSPGSKDFRDGTMPPTMQQDAKRTHHKHSTSMANLPSEAKIVTIGFAAIPVITHSEKNVAGQFNTKPTHQQNSGRRSPQKLPSEAGRTSRLGTSRNQLSNASQPRLGQIPNEPVNFTNSRTPDPFSKNQD